MENGALPLRLASGNRLGGTLTSVCVSLSSLSAPHRGRCAYPKAQVRIEGDNKIYERDAESGFKIRFHFCPNCGSKVFWEGDRTPTPTVSQ
jgi:hypothetical protein